MDILAVQKRSSFIWYFLICLQVLFVAICVFFGMQDVLWQEDKTKLSFVIAGLWAVTSLIIGFWHKKTDAEAISKNVKIGWYLAETCLALGMIGTVAGFLLMLGAAFGNINVGDTASLQQALSDMAVGMSTALYTTLVGLVASLFLKSQLVNLEHYLDGLS